MASRTPKPSDPSAHAAAAAGPRSRELFARAAGIIPGGVNSPVRAFRAVGGDPLFLARGAGARVWDVDGREYLDFVGSWGPLILGHAHPDVIAAITAAAARGTSFGAPTELEVRFAEALRAAVPSLEMVRCVSSGTEATMSAIRVARGYTARDKIVKVDGGYHGHADFLLVEAGSGAATLGIPGSAGVPAGTARDTLVAPWNDLDAMRALFAANRGQIAAVIVEPVCGNMGVVPPASGYLAGLRELTASEGALLVFDEVITGFRVAFGGAQARYGIAPDLTCLGKIVGGGLPAACFGGRADVMSRLAPLGPVYQAGTLSGNPLALAAGLTAIELLSRPGTYDRLEGLGARLEKGLRAAAAAAEIPCTVNRVGSMLTGFFHPGPVTDYASAKKSDTAGYGRFFRAMLARGVYLAPSQFEAAFVSLAHTDEDIDQACAAAAEALREVAGSVAGPRARGD
jgi:glutamate-1-semialdehyde 2,1-aminomutase